MKRTLLSVCACLLCGWAVGQEVAVQTMQVFRRLPQNISARHLQREQARMDSIYQVIRNDSSMDFSRLVEQFSDDKRCRWIAPLQTTSEFEDIAFSLPTGGVSQPFFTPEGLHILKVTDRKVVSPQTVDSLASRFSSRRLSEQAATVERLKMKYQYAPNVAAIDGLLQKGETNDTLFTVDGQPYTGEMFRQFASAHPQSVKRQWDGFVTKSLLGYDYRLYTDSCKLAAAAAAETAKPEQLLPEEKPWTGSRYKGVVIHSIDKKTAKRAKKMAKKLLKKAPEEEWAVVLRAMFNTNGVERIKVEQGLFAEGDNPYIDKLVFKKGNFEPVESYPVTLVVGKKLKKP